MTKSKKDLGVQSILSIVQADNDQFKESSNLQKLGLSDLPEIPEPRLPSVQAADDQFKKFLLVISKNGEQPKPPPAQSDDDELRESPRIQEQLWTSSAQVGKGRGRGRSVSHQVGVPAPSVIEKKEVKSKGRGRGSKSPHQIDPPVSLVIEKHRITKGRGRGSYVFHQAIVPESLGHEILKENSKGSIENYPKLSTSSAEIMAPLLETEINTEKKVLHKEEQNQILSQVANINLDYKAEIATHKKFTLRPPNLPLINDRNHIPLFVNYFKLTFNDEIVIYHYDINISDSTEGNKFGRFVSSEERTAKSVELEKCMNMSKAKCCQIISEVFKNTPVLRQFCPVYDGKKNLFTSKPLPCKKEPFPVEIVIEDKKKCFYVTITPVVKEKKNNIISLEPLVNLYQSHIKITDIPYEVLLAYDVVMKHREPPIQKIAFRNSLFSLSNLKILGSGLRIGFGYHQKVQLTELGPVVVLDLAAKAFHNAGAIVDYANEVLKTDITKLPKLQVEQIENLTNAFKGVQVRVTHQKHPRKYKIKAVKDQSADDLIIDVGNRKMSVSTYFWETYQIKLSYSYLPCLHMRTNNNNTYMPMELCKIIEGQPKIGKINADLTSKMIRETAVAPQERLNRVLNIADEVSDISKTYMHAFGLLMDVKLLKVDGHVLAAPQLAYYGSKDETSRIAKPDIKGVWHLHDGKKFYKVVKVNKWVVISFVDKNQLEYQVIKNYCEYLCKSSEKCGLHLNQPLSIDIYDKNTTTSQALSKAKEYGAQLVIVVLNRQDSYHSYDEVKFLADFTYNLVTQCMEDKTLKRINDQITTNVCLKLNVKLGGINHILLHRPKIFSKRVIVFGIDAIHWPRGYGYPSIVAVVGSLDQTASRYALTCDLQKNKKCKKMSQEIIRHMGELAKEILKNYTDANNNIHPDKIIVFRDGVSEGQFQQALDYEVSGIQKACMDLFGTYIPMTFIVVQKRHHTRLFPTNPSQGIGKNRNVCPGTCVDRDITHPVFFDYFICSHEGIQGTSKPAHYTVLHNDNEFKIEELEQLCYSLCHTYVRCTRSVSLPAPVIYADLAAARAKKYADLFVASENISVSSVNDQRDLPPEVEKAITSMKSCENSMFYI